MPLKVALLGCGGWGKNLARNFNSLGVLNLVCDPFEQARIKANQIAPNVKTTGFFEDAFRDPHLHGVVIATPAETHFELVKRALESGKDVFVEKPMALSVADGKKLERIALERGSILMVGHLLEYHPAVKKLKDLVQRQELGALRYIYSHRLNFGKVRVEENALWSFAPHDVAVILRLTGELPTEVYCTGGSYLTPGLADVTMSVLKFRSGIRAHIFVSWLNPFKEQKLVVTGSERMAVFNDVSEDKLMLHDQSVEFEDRKPILRNDGSRAIDLPCVEPLRIECEHFIDCIKTRETPLTDSQSAIRVLKVLEACQKSMESNGQSVELNG